MKFENPKMEISMFSVESIVTDPSAGGQSVDVKGTELVSNGVKVYTADYNDLW